MYCPLRDSLEAYRGKGTCQKVHEQTCDGSISLLQRTSKDDAWPSTVKLFMFHELVELSEPVTAAAAGASTAMADEL